jgi:DNA-binding NtrC family response regulator/tetratricopeptide (TPR) repeat protein
MGDAHPPGDSTADILGASPALTALRAQIQHLASFDTINNPHVPTVLLQGETGTGKGLVAGVIHRSGPRADGPFVDVNCAAIPETMLEAELFGFEAGAFTDAKRAKAGLFEAASGGTLFLDEIDALSVPLQSKLLKAIEEKNVRRLGAVRPLQVDVKLIAATQRDLQRLVADGGFRADLYHRLAVVILTIPPLRARSNDVALLADHYLQAYGQAHGLAPRTLTQDARRWLREHNWPGNVREISHLMERVTLLTADGEVQRETLERLAVPLATPPDSAGRADGPTAEAEAGQVGDRTDDGGGDEAWQIRDALIRAGGNVVGAARLLGIGRNALRYRMRRFGVERPTLDELRRAPADRSGAADPDRRQKSTTEPAAEPGRWEQKAAAVLAVELSFPDPGDEMPVRYDPWTVAMRWDRVIEEKVRGFGGVVVSRAPARLLAVFGVPRALEQMPQRAVQAAWALQRLVESAPGPRPQLRTAVHVGTLHVDTSAVTSPGGILAVGDALALPERLLGHAGEGEVLTSSQAARRIDRFCELQERPLQIGPRDNDRITAYAVVGQRPDRWRAEVVREGAADSPFVGRQQEIDVLGKAFASAAAGHGQVLFVAGEPGIGKSRLLFELRQRLGSVPHLWVEGRCHSYGSATPFLPVVDALRRYVGIDDRDDEVRATEKIDAAIADLSSGLEWTLPFVRQALSLAPGNAAVAALDSANRRSELFRALRAIIVQAAERQPVVLAIEDLHWIDPESAEFLTFVGDAIPTTRVLLVLSYRTGHHHGFADRSYHVRVTLLPLSGGEMAAMTDAVLGVRNIPTEVRDLIARKAEGNPFFVEEVVRSLLEDGSLKQEADGVALVRAASAIMVPDTIHDVLIARIDRLDTHAKRALQVASVIGREFALRLLERIVTRGHEVQTRIEELRGLELIYEKAFHPELAYMFKHALTHDVAYRSVLPDRRTALHRTIGLAIEELYADRLAEHYETLAHHFGCGEDWQRALAYHERAADKAGESYANRAVVAHCRQALEIADRLGDQVADSVRRRLEEKVALASFLLSDFSGSAAAHERAAEHARRGGGTHDLDRCAISYGNASLSYFWAHDYAGMNRSIDRALEIAARQQCAPAEALALSVRGYYRGVHDGDLEAYAQQCGQALELCAGAGHEVIEAQVRFALAQHAEWTGDYPRAIALAEQAIASGRTLRLPHLVIWPGWFLGKAACCLGDYGRAIRLLQDAYDICDRIGDRAWRSRLLNTLGWCLSEVGSDARALAYNDEARTVAREIDDHEAVANAEINLAGNYLALGDAGAAAACLDPIVETPGDLLVAPGDPWMHWRYSLHALDALARLALHQGDPERAAALTDREIAGARRHRVPKVEARGLELRGRALLVLDRRDEARVVLDEALRVAGRIAYRRTSWRAHGSLAELERRAGCTAEADRHAAEARGLIEQASRSLPEDALRQQLLAGAV